MVVFEMNGVKLGLTRCVKVVYRRDDMSPISDIKPIIAVTIMDCGYACRPVVLVLKGSYHVLVTLTSVSSHRSMGVEEHTSDNVCCA